MREMKQSEERLSEALRHLGRVPQQSAPPELYTRLASAFRAHHARRRRVQRARVLLALVGCLACGIALLRMLPIATYGPGTKQATEAVHTIPPQESNSSESQIASEAHRQDTAQRHAPRQAGSKQVADDFVALPSYDPNVLAEGLHIIRLDMRGADLRLVGAPVSEELSQRRVVADFVIGQDGTPYAVRLVQ
jgi:hypothetical protein